MKTIPTRVLLVQPSSDLGGVSQYLLKLIRHSSENVELCFAGPAGGALMEDIDFKKKVRFFPLPMAYKTLGGINAEAKTLRKIIVDQKINVVHAHNLRAAFLCAYAIPNRYAVKFIYTPHGFRFIQKGNIVGRFIFYIIDYFVCSRAGQVVVLSQSEKNDAIQSHLPRAKSYAIIPTFIDVPSSVPAVQRPTGVPNDAFVVSMIGRITPQKNPFGFLRVATLVKKVIPKAFFIWVGDGELRNELESQVKTAELENSFLIMGQISHDKVLTVPSYSDVVLFTSWYEGLPIVLLEMLSIGVPAVAARVGGVPDIIKDGVTGWLFQPADYKLAAKLVSGVLHASSEDLSRMETQQRSLITERYAPESREAAEYERIYR